MLAEDLAVGLDETVVEQAKAEGLERFELEVLVVDQVGELQHEPIGDGESGGEHDPDRTPVRVAAEVAGKDMAA